MAYFGAEGGGRRRSDATQSNAPEFKTNRIRMINGKGYPITTGGGDRTVCSHSVDDVAKYVCDIAGDNRIDDGSVIEHVPYHSIDDYFSTILAAEQSHKVEQVKFRLACTGIAYRQQVAVALCAMPPGFAFGIHNKLDPPAHFLAEPAPDGGRRSSDAIRVTQQEGRVKDYSHEDWVSYQHRRDQGLPDQEDSRHRETQKLEIMNEPTHHFRDEVREFYVGCDPFLLPEILTTGFKASFGEASDELLERFGVPVPGVLPHDLRCGSMVPLSADYGANRFSA